MFTVMAVCVVQESLISRLRHPKRIRISSWNVRTRTTLYRSSEAGSEIRHYVLVVADDRHLFRYINRRLSKHQRPRRPGINRSGLILRRFPKRVAVLLIHQDMASCDRSFTSPISHISGGRREQQQAVLFEGIGISTCP